FRNERIMDLIVKELTNELKLALTRSKAMKKLKNEKNLALLPNRLSNEQQQEIVCHKSTDDDGLAVRNTEFYCQYKEIEEEFNRVLTTARCDAKLLSCQTHPRAFYTTEIPADNQSTEKHQASRPVETVSIPLDESIEIDHQEQTPQIIHNPPKNS
ncbi:26949_t:CDS:2, partial [Racocetra persica]